MISEKEFQAQVIALAVTAGWKVYHTYRSVRSDPGFPDLTMVHEKARLIVFAELKVGKNRPTPAQWEWLRVLSCVGSGANVGAYLWTPEEWPHIQAVLAQKYLNT